MEIIRTIQMTFPLLIYLLSFGSNPTLQFSIMMEIELTSHRQQCHVSAKSHFIHGAQSYNGIHSF